MTREEELDWLCRLRSKMPLYMPGDWVIPMNDALDMAIKALEQEPILDKIRAEIKEWYWQADKQALAKDPCVIDAMIDLFIRTIDKYRAESEDKVCKDCHYNDGEVHAECVVCDKG